MTPEIVRKFPLARSPVQGSPKVAKPTVKWSFAEWFILSQAALPALLYLPGTQSFRVAIRMASYGLGLGALVYYWGLSKHRPQLRRRLHPASPWLMAVIAYLGLMLLHPTSNSFVAGLAQIGLYLAILSPVLWVQACVEDSRQLKRLLWILLICNGVNCFVGVMQVHNPAVWMPRQISSVITESEMGMGTVIYEGAEGMIVRPPGLGDSPGAVAGPGIFALYFGLVFAASDNIWWKRILAVIFAGLGAEAIFLSLVRSSFLIAMGMLVLFFVIQLCRGLVKEATTLLVIAIVAIGLAFIQSSTIGGENLIERFKTILAGDPLDFYYENRGVQVASGFKELLPTYPLGAGLGRWGMMNMYFGDQANAASPPIFVEIQWPGWIVDGGFILCLLYPVALLITVWQLMKTAFRRGDEVSQHIAGVVLAASIGLLALCFSYCVFVSPMGTQFWFLAGAVQGVSARRREELARLRPSSPVKSTRAPRATLAPRGDFLDRPNPTAPGAAGPLPAR